MTDDLQTIATDLTLSAHQVEKTIQLLDAGNTIPFITRFRKDETGGLRASQIQSVQFAINQLRALAERKTFVTKSIDSQGKLDDALKAKIEAAKSSREIEDLYLPFKPKQQSLAMTARQQGLEPLANEVFAGDRPDVDLATRSTEFVRVDRELNSVDEVIAGVGHILSERMSESTDLRDQLRKIVWESGRFSVTTLEVKEEPTEESEKEADDSTTASESTSSSEQNSPSESVAEPQSKTEAPADQVNATNPRLITTAPETETVKPTAATPETNSTEETTSEPDQVPAADEASTASPEADSSSDTSDSTPPADSAVVKSIDKEATSETAAAPKKKKKSKKKKKVEHPFKDFENFDQPINRIPHHRLLAINRGERAGLLKVKFEADKDKLAGVMQQQIPGDHPFKAFLEKCSKDALTRLVVPSLEREARRELTETAEQHATRVFALNLRNLLLQPPVRNKRILAIDPGYKRGCTLAVLNGLGRLLESERMAVVGNQAKKDDSRKKIANLVEKHMVDVIVIGNGSACRQTEEIVSLTLENELAGKGIQYVIVNEAGASYYSTSELGAADLPDQTPLVRSAISIGRRLVNPLSELVKISPANIGVGLYQHDIKSKHLSETLDEVVRDCVNLVGVDVNSAGPALLSQVAGLNQLTARRIVEHRNEQGPFKNREGLKEVSGIGESTFVQAAGFLRVYGGDNPLDETSIHPESYELATNILGKINATAEQLPKRKPEPVPVSVVQPAVQPKPGAPAETATETPAADVKPESATEAAAPAPAPEASPTPEATPTSETTTPVPAAAETPVVTPEPQPAAGPAPSRSAARDDSHRQWKETISKLDIDELAKEFSIGKMRLTDIVRALKHPSHDPRQKMDAPIFRSGIIKIDDLKPEMKLTAQVVNVVDFGVFVDIGLGVSCLVHISQLSNRYMKDLHQHFVVCDRINVWVKEIDKDKRRVQLTAIAPGSKSGNRGGGGGGGKRPSGGGSRPQGKGGNRGPRNQQRGRKDNRSFRKDRRPSKPRKPAKKITDEMLSGEKPMTAFSDLLQFYDKNKDEKK
jgi:uncharacterized protein